MRLRLFDALMRLILDRGYATVTLADIAAEAGVGRTAVYNHFPDKESLLVALAEHQTEIYMANLTEEMATAADPMQRLGVYIRLQLTELAGQHAHLAGLSEVLSEESRVRLRNHVAPMITVLSGILKEAMEAGDIPQQDLPTLVRLVSATLAGRTAAGMTGERLDAAVQAATLYVLRGIGAGR